MKQVIITYGKAKELGIWSEICKREGWNENNIERWLYDYMSFSIDEDLVMHALRKDEKQLDNTRL